MAKYWLYLLLENIIDNSIRDIQMTLLRIVIFVYFDETNELEQVYVKMLIKFQILAIQLLQTFFYPNIIIQKILQVLEKYEITHEA